MGISNEKKKEILLKNFDIIKDNYEKNNVGLASAIVKMLKIDSDTAADMWSYLVTKHASKVNSRDAWFLTGNIMYEGGKAIGKDDMAELVLNTPVLKNAIFAQAGDDIHLFVCDIIQKKINAGELQAADELLSLVYNNKYKNDSWYVILDNIIPDNPNDLEVTDEAYELLDMWCDKVTDQEDRAKLSIKMMEYMD